MRFGAMALAAALLAGACNLNGGAIHLQPEETAAVTEQSVVPETTAVPVIVESEPTVESTMPESMKPTPSSEAAVIDETVTETPSITREIPPAEATTEASTEPTTEASAEPTTEASAETTTEASTEATTEASTEPITEASTEPATEATTVTTTAESTTTETAATEPETTETTAEAVTTAPVETEPSTVQGSTANQGSNSGYSSLGLPEPDSHRRFRSGSVWPENYNDSFSTIEITPEVRKDILSFGTALVGLPYVYPRTDTWWAPDSIYTYSYDILYRSRKEGGKEGDFDYVYGPDCSAFVKAVVDFAAGSKMHNYVPTMRTAMMSRPEYEKPVDDMSAWIPGDILILGEGEGSYRHVAIYFGDGYLLHSVGYRVQISHISDWSFRPRGDLFVKHVFAPPGVLTERSNIPPSGALTLPADFAVPVQIPAHIRESFGIVTSPAAVPDPTDPTAAATETTAEMPAATTTASTTAATTAASTAPATTATATTAPSTEASPSSSIPAEEVTEPAEASAASSPGTDSETDEQSLPVQEGAP